MEILLLLTIIISAMIAFFRAVITNSRTENIDSIDLFTYSFAGGLFGGLIGSLIGIALGYIVYFIVPDNDGGFIFPSDTYKLIAGYISFLACWFVGTIVGAIKVTKA